VVYDHGWTENAGVENEEGSKTGGEGGKHSLHRSGKREGEYSGGKRRMTYRKPNMVLKLK